MRWSVEAARTGVVSMMSGESGFPAGSLPRRVRKARRMAYAATDSAAAAKRIAKPGVLVSLPSAPTDPNERASIKMRPCPQTPENKKPIDAASPPRINALGGTESEGTLTRLPFDGTAPRPIAASTKAEVGM